MVSPRIQGALVYRELQSALEDARSDSGRLREEFEELDAEVDRLVARRGKALNQLARSSLPALTADHVAGSFPAIREDLLVELRRSKIRQQELRAAVQQLEQDRGKLETNLAAVTAELDEAVKRRDKLQAVAAARLAADEKFQQLSHEVVHAEQLLAQDEQRAREIQNEAKEKLPSYENSRLFQYLYQRKFGTAHYASRGLIRRMDRWVAGLVGYTKARRGYDFLRSTPELIKNEVARRREDFETKAEQVEALEDSVSDELGLTEVLRDGQRLGGQRDDLLRSIEQYDRRIQETEEELSRLQSAQGEYYERSIGRYRTFLNSTQTTLLEQHARSTPGSEDDRIVAEVVEIKSLLDDLQSRMAKLKSTSEKAGRVVRELEDVAGRFRREGYDSGRSFFEAGFEARRQIEKFRAGEITRNDLWRSIRENQQFHEPAIRFHRPDAVSGRRTAGPGPANGPTRHRSSSPSPTPGGSDTGGVLMDAMVNVVGPMLVDVLGRAAQRRGTAAQTRRRKRGRPPTSGGFTHGGGF